MPRRDGSGSAHHHTIPETLDTCGRWYWP